MIGTVFRKPVEDWDAYAQAAEWCNTHGACIVEYEDYYEVVSAPEKTFEELKTDKLSELENAFTVRTKGSVKTSQGYLMQFDTIDSLKMQGAITLMEAVGATVGYITQADDKTIYDISIDTMKAVLIEMLNAYAQCHARKQELRELINKALSKEELAEITISWPV